MFETDSLDLPLFSGSEDRWITSREGKRLPRWGSVQVACKMLDGCRRQELYELIEAGSVRAYKLRPHRPNSHWKVDLLSVWNHKQAQLRARQ